MVFYTISTFRQSLAALTKKSKDGYMSVVSDICNSLVNMPDNILRDTNDRIRQFAEFRVVKLRLPNSGQHLLKRARHCSRNNRDIRCMRRRGSLCGRLRVHGDPRSRHWGNQPLGFGAGR